MSRSSRSVQLIYERASDRISDRQRIVELIVSAQSDRCTVTVSVPGGTDHYHGVILKTGDTALWIDELAPVEGNAELMRVGQAQIYASLRGVGIHFSAPVEESGENDGVVWHRLSLPEILYRLQKRGWSRVPASAARPIAVRIEPLVQQDGGYSSLHLPATAKMVHGRLLDISCGGAALLLPADSGVDMGRKFRRCIIDTPDGGPLAVAMEIRHILVTKPSGTLRVSARFHDLAVRELREIERLIRTLERTELRRRRRTNVLSWEPPE